MSQIVSQSRFLNLPLELRNLIYDFAISAPTAISITTTVDTHLDAQEAVILEDSIPGLPRNHVPRLSYYTNAASAHATTESSEATPPSMASTKHDIDHSSDSDGASRPRKRARRFSPSRGYQAPQMPYLPYLAFSLFQVNKQINRELTSHLTKRRIQNVAASFSFSHSDDPISPSTSYDSQDSPFPSVASNESDTSSCSLSPDSVSSHSYKSPIGQPGAGLRLHVTYPYGVLVLKHKYPDLVMQATEISITGYHVTHEVRRTSRMQRTVLRPPMSKETWDAAKTALEEITRKVLSPQPSPLLELYDFRILIPDEDGYREMWEDGSPVAAVLYNICGGKIDMNALRGTTGNALRMTVRPNPTRRCITSRHSKFDSDEDWSKLDAPARFEDQWLAFFV